MCCIMCVKFHISGNLFTLKKEGHVCGALSNRHDTSERKNLGSFNSVTECALACKSHSDCKHFSYGRFTGIGVGTSRLCNWEKTLKPYCPAGFVRTNDYDFYALSGNI